MERLAVSGDDLPVLGRLAHQGRGLRPRRLGPPAPSLRALPSQSGGSEPAVRAGTPAPIIPRSHHDTRRGPDPRREPSAPEWGSNVVPGRDDGPPLRAWAGRRRRNRGEARMAIATGLILGIGPSAFQEGRFGFCRRRRCLFSDSLVLGHQHRRLRSERLGSRTHLLARATEFDQGLLQLVIHRSSISTNGSRRTQRGGGHGRPLIPAAELDARRPSLTEGTGRMRTRPATQEALAGARAGGARFPLAVESSMNRAAEGRPDPGAGPAGTRHRAFGLSGSWGRPTCRRRPAVGGEQSGRSHRLSSRGHPFGIGEMGEMAAGFSDSRPRLVPRPT
jgi:hypothetical protein